MENSLLYSCSLSTIFFQKHITGLTLWTGITLIQHVFPPQLEKRVKLRHQQTMVKSSVAVLLPPATCRSALGSESTRIHLTEPPQFTAGNQKLLHQSQDRRPTDLPESTGHVRKFLLYERLMHQLFLIVSFSVHEQSPVQTGPIIF